LKLLPFIKYTRSPQAKFLVPLEEVYAGTRWAAENGKSINVDATRIIGAIELKST
jgi:acetyl esterase